MAASSQKKTCFRAFEIFVTDSRTSNIKWKPSANFDFGRPRFMTSLLLTATATAPQSPISNSASDHTGAHVDDDDDDVGDGVADGPLLTLVRC